MGLQGILDCSDLTAQLLHLHRLFAASSFNGRQFHFLSFYPVLFAMVSSGHQSFINSIVINSTSFKRGSFGHTATVNCPLHKKHWQVDTTCLPWRDYGESSSHPRVRINCVSINKVWLYWQFSNRYYIWCNAHDTDYRSFFSFKGLSNLRMSWTLCTSSAEEVILVAVATDCL